MICKHCNNTFQTIHTLDSHQKNAKYCIGIQNHLNLKRKCSKEFSKNKRAKIEEKDDIMDMDIDYNSDESIQVSNDPYILKINNVNIVYRKEDDFIDLASLCKAGEKDFKYWFRLNRTKIFLNNLSTHLELDMNNLIVNFLDISIWGHQQIAINIANWISPIFEVKVTTWIQYINKIKYTENITLDSIKSIISFNEQISELKNTTKKSLIDVVDVLKNDFNCTPSDYNGFNTNYIGYIGEIDGKSVFKHGESCDFLNRYNKHCKTFDRFDIIAVYKCKNSIVCERSFKEVIASEKLSFKMDNYKELFYIEDKDTLIRLRNKLKSICEKDLENNYSENKDENYIKLEIEKTKLESKKILFELLNNGKISLEQFVLMEKNDI